MGELNSFGKWVTVLGLMLTAAGIFFWTGGKIPWLGRLPGDVRVENGHFKFYFPIVTCFLISIALSFLFWFISKFK